MKKLFKCLFIIVVACTFTNNVNAANVGDTYKCTYYINVSQNGSTKRVNLLNVYWRFTEFNKYQTYTPEGGNSYEPLENEFFKVTTPTYIMATTNSLCPTYCVTQSTDNSQLKFQTDGIDCLQTGVINSEKTTIKLAANNSTNNNNSNNNNSNNNAKNIKNAFLGNTTCGGLTNFTFPNALPAITSFLYTLLKIAIPVILVVKGSIDLFKAAASQKEDEMKKAQKKFTQRLIAGGIALLAFIIVETVINFIANRTGNGNAIKCVNCFIKNQCETVNNDGHGGSY